MAALALKKDTFQNQIGQGVTLVDFWAPWCGPCKIQLPIIEELAVELQGRITIAKVNVDEEPELAAQYRVMSIPTLILFQDGNIVKTMVGVHNKDVLKEKLELQ